jgi:hypothetical protein
MGAGDPRTFLVECYAPGIDTASAGAAADRARAAVAGLRSEGRDLDYLGALLMAEDEVVFHAFHADAPALVREASARAGLQFERIVETVGIPSPGADAVPELIAGRTTLPDAATTDGSR